MYLRKLIATNIRSAIALRGAFALQMVFMIANNGIFFLIWWLFFQTFPMIGEWRLNEVALLYGIVATSFGCHIVLFGGTRQLALAIEEGELDHFLTKPKNPLIHIACSRSYGAGWGDIVSGMILIVLSGYTQPLHGLLALMAIICSCVIFTCTIITIHSLSFFVGSIFPFARQFSDFLTILSVNPQNIYTGAVRILIFTILPAGFIGYLPVELLRQPSWLAVAGILAGTALYALVATGVFHQGLKHYESGSRVGLRL